MSRTEEVPEDKKRPTVVTLPRVPHRVCFRRPIEIRDCEELEIDFGDAENYQLLQRIGRGRYSHVYDSFNLKENVPCVIKKLVTSDEREVKRELIYLDILREGPNIIHSLDILKMDVRGEKFVYGIVFEKVRNVDYRILYRQLSDFYIRYYLYQLLRALDYAHLKGVMHRDVKPGNIVIDHERKILRLIDWGFGALYIPGQAYYCGACTLPYRAPELLLGYRLYHYAMDMWSFGCVAAGMIFRVHLFFDGVDEPTQLQQIGRLLGRRKLDEYLAKYKIRSRTEHSIDRSYEGTRFESFLRPENRETATCTALDFLRKILVYDHQERLTAAEAKKHPYFRLLKRVIHQARNSNLNKNAAQQERQNGDKEADSKKNEGKKRPKAQNGGAKNQTEAAGGAKNNLDSGTTGTPETSRQDGAGKEEDKKTSIVDLGDLPDVDPNFIAGLMEDFRDGAGVEEYRRSSPNQPGPSHQGQYVEDFEYNAAEDSFFEGEDNTYDYMESDNEEASDCEPTEVCDAVAENSPKKSRRDTGNVLSDAESPSQNSLSETRDAARRASVETEAVPQEMLTTSSKLQEDAGVNSESSPKETLEISQDQQEDFSVHREPSPEETLKLPQNQQENAIIDFESSLKVARKISQDPEREVDDDGAHNESRKPEHSGKKRSRDVETPPQDEHDDGVQ